ncbi:MAG TPA: glycosyltransferase [Parafilimonas sp.]|nr:glycosyltransferase [Parafilimonas sp.]
MNIVHLTTFHTGGAGTAAIQLHKALLEIGINSSLVFVQSLPKDSTIPCSYSLSHQNVSTRIRNKVKNLSFNKTEKHFRQIGHAIDAENISLPFSDYNILKHPIIGKADILHLHWVAGMIDYRTFFKNCTKKIIWTLHDMNPLNGLFFYKEDEYRNRLLTGHLNQEILNIKHNALSSLKTKMYITAPSNWLTNEAKDSKLLNNFECITIPNIVDLKTYDLCDKSECREELNIRQDSILLLFMAMSVTNKRKGFDLLKNSLLRIKNRALIEIIAIGEIDEIDVGDLGIKFTGEIKNKALLVKYYAAADALILPSREDNLPNTMLEAFGCGLPVIGFPVGGIKEHIKDEVTGYLSKEVSSEALYDSIMKFLKNPKIFQREKIRKYAEVNFNEKTIVNKFLNLYSMALAN